MPIVGEIAEKADGRVHTFSVHSSYIMCSWPRHLVNITHMRNKSQRGFTVIFGKAKVLVTFLSGKRNATGFFR